MQMILQYHIFVWQKLLHICTMCIILWGKKVFVFPKHHITSSHFFRQKHHAHKGTFCFYYLQMVLCIGNPWHYLNYKNSMILIFHYLTNYKNCKFVITNCSKCNSLFLKNHQRNFFICICYCNKTNQDSITFPEEMKLPSSRLARSCNWDFVTPLILTVILASTAQNSFYWHRQDGQSYPINLLFSTAY